LGESYIELEYLFEDVEEFKVLLAALKGVDLQGKGVVVVDRIDVIIH
jgi:hypothetical protein